MKLTQRNVAKLRLPSGKTDHIEWDDDLPGFGVRLRESTRASWITQYRVGAEQRRMRLGLVAELDAAQARNLAADVLARVRLGQNPQADKREARKQSADKLGPAIELYLTRRERDRGRPRHRDRTLNEAIRYLRDERGAYWRPLHHMPLATLTRRDLAARRAAIETQNGQTTATAAWSKLRAFFSWAVQAGLVDANPTTGIKNATQPSRDRVLSDDELAAVWRACRDDDYGRIVRLLILTGQRREEVGDLRWQEIDGDTIALPPERTKNNRPHKIYLSNTARDIVGGVIPRASSAFVFGRNDGFGGWGAAKAALDRRIAAARGEPLKAWTIHDLRRTAATRMAELGILPHVIEATLNHISGHRAGVAGIYNRSTYEREKAVALNRWSDHIAALVEGRQSNVTPLMRA
jgi:integrase